jgi:hypothetical protein
MKKRLREERKKLAESLNEDTIPSNASEAQSPNEEKGLDDNSMVS